MNTTGFANKPLRWGILGTGSIARKFATQLPQSQRGQLVAVGSRTHDTARRFAHEFNCTLHGSYEEILADPSVDAIYNSLPNGLHHEWSIAALQAGKHVLCEKPLAVNAKQTEEMFTFATSTNRLLVEGFMYRCQPVIHKLLDLVHTGAIGQIKLIRSNFTFNRPDLTSDARYQRDMGGGSLMDVGCYCINLCRALTRAEPEAMHAIAHMHSSRVDEYAAGTLRFPGGVLATFTCGMTVEADRSTFIGGSHGHITIPFPWHSDGTLILTQGTREQRLQIEPAKTIFATEADEFAAAAAGEKPPWITPTDTLGNMRVLDELRREIGIII